MCSSDLMIRRPPRSTLFPYTTPSDLYVVQELVTDDHLTLTKNTNYWNGSPKLDKLTIRTISDGDTLSAALQAGNIDAAYGMAYEAYPNFENDDYQFSAIQTSRAFFASMNMASPVMQDPAVRKAIVGVTLAP